MLTLRPYGACVLFDALNYKHCVPTGLGTAFCRPHISYCLLPPASYLLLTSPCCAAARLLFFLLINFVVHTLTMRI